MSLPDHLTLEIVTPDHAVVSKEIDELQVPGADGSFGVLPGHTPLLAGLRAGELWYRQGQNISYVAVSLGFAEVLPDRVTILAEEAEPAAEIDVPRAEAAQEQARNRLDHPVPDLDFRRADLAMRKSLVRLQVATRVRTQG